MTTERQLTNIGANIERIADLDITNIDANIERIADALELLAQCVYNHENGPCIRIGGGLDTYEQNIQ